MNYVILSGAYAQLDNIYDYTLREWGEAQAIEYTGGIFDCFDRISSKEVIWQPVPVEFDIYGYFTRYEKHFIYWKLTQKNQIAIVAILHQRMHQIERLSEAFKL